MKILSRPFGCLLLALFAMTFLVSCPKKSPGIPDAWIYLKGHRLSFADDFKKLEKDYNLSVYPYRCDLHMRWDHYYNVVGQYSETNPLCCSLFIYYDKWTKRILSIEINYEFDGKVTKKDLEQLSKEVYFDKFRSISGPLCKDVEGVRYVIHTKYHGDMGFSVVSHSISVLYN